MTYFPSDNAWLIAAAACWRRCVWLAACHLLVLSQACGAPGDLDLTFGTGGKVTGFAVSDVTSVILQSDGKIVVGGGYQFATARLNANGTPDTSFNGSGKVTTEVSPPDGRYHFDYGYCAAVQADGKIIVGGETDLNGRGTDYGCVLVRYNSNGSLDTTFAGTGVVKDNFDLTQGGIDEGFTTLAVQDDGKIVAAGFFHYQGTPFTSIAIARFNANGGGDVRNTFISTAYSPNVGGVLALPDGKIVLAGSATLNGTRDFLLLRYNADLTLDTSFNGVGYVLTPPPIGTGGSGESIVRQNDGKLIVGGSTYNGNHYEFALVRYNADGTLDSSFNGTGKLTTVIGVSDSCTSVALQYDGRIVAGGRSSNGSNDDFALVRYNANGSLDTSFNGTGKVTTSMSSGNDAIYDVAVQSDGRIVVVGRSSSASVVARYEGGPITRIDEWRVTNFGTNANQLVAGDGANPERDGLFNLAEYALLLSPTIRSLPPSAERFLYAEGERLRMFVPRDPERNDITVEVQATDDLASGPWMTLATSSLGAPFSGPGYVGGDDASPGVKTVEVRDLVNIDAAPQRCMRIKVTH